MFSKEREQEIIRSYERDEQMMILISPSGASTTILTQPSCTAALIGSKRRTKRYGKQSS